MINASLRPGEFFQPYGVSGTSQLGEQIVLDEVLQGATSFRGDCVFSGEAICKRLVVKHPNTQAPVWKALWCLNGPKNILFRRYTRRDTEHKAIRQRDDRPAEQHAGRLEFMFPEGYSSLDHCLLNIGGQVIRFCSIPSEYGPLWSKNYVVEIPISPYVQRSDDTNDSVVEALSFVLGKRLIRIGETIYGADNYPIKESANNPWSINLNDECGQPELPPITLSTNESRILDESIVSSICEQFYNARKEVHFSDSLSSFWASRTVPAEGSIVFLSMALESLMNAWFKSKKSRSRGKYLSDQEFAPLIKDVLSLAVQRMGDREYKDRILNRIQGSNNVGANERIEFFFQEIGIPLTEFEKDILSRVNHYRHGGSSNASQLKNLILAIRAYETLYHRALLKIIGHTGTYIDYSTYGFPTKSISESLGGPAGDGTKLTR